MRRTLLSGFAMISLAVVVAGSFVASPAIAQAPTADPPRQRDAKIGEPDRYPPIYDGRDAWAWAKVLCDRKDGPLREAHDALQKLGKAAVPAVLQVYAEGDWYARREALRVFVKLAEEAGVQGVETIVRAMKDPDGRVRARAVTWASVMLGAKPAQEEDVLLSGDFDASEEARQAREKYFQAVQAALPSAVIEALGDQDPRVCTQAIECFKMGRLPSVAPADRLLPLLDPKWPPALRLDAALMLGVAGGEKELDRIPLSIFIDGIRRRMTDASRVSEWQMRKILLVLERLGPRAKDAVAPLEELHKKMTQPRTPRPTGPKVPSLAARALVEEISNSLEQIRGEKAKDQPPAEEKQASVDARQAEDTGGDIQWALEELRRSRALRINCGGNEHRGADGKVWAADRFYASGYRFFGDEYSGADGPFTDEIAGTADDPLYQTERYFWIGAPGLARYKVPLPRGTYRVTLHFAELFHRLPGERVFDVLLEGKKVLAGYEPLRAGFATAKAEAFTVSVEDDALEIDFVVRFGNPKISAIEIEPMGEGK